MKFQIPAAIALLSAPLCPAAVKTEIAHSESDKKFELGQVTAPSSNDAATSAIFTLVDGERDGNGGNLSVLHDGRVPEDADQPSSNFFFRGGGGRIEVALGKAISIRSIHSYSWHTGARAPQVYRVWASTGEGNEFVKAPKRDTDPKTVGWTPIAKVDTRKNVGGQHAAAVTDPRAGNLGKFRHLLFDIEPSDAESSQSNTFLSEIDVIDASGPAPAPVLAKVLKTYPSPDGKYQYVVDATLAPDLEKWVEKELMPVVFEWYPKLVAMLPSDRFTAPETVVLEFRDDMGGTPAYALGNKLSMSVPWFRTQLEKEAKGCVIHELVHIVQNYWRARVTNGNPAPNPGWVVEGIADYVRWFVYEPESKGAEITQRNFGQAKYDASYRITANFFDWIVQTHDKEFVQKLNAAAREGRYSETLWKEATGKTVEELGAEWKAAHAKRLGV